MSVELLKKEKKNKPFRKGDLLLYAVCALLIAGAFLWIFFLPKGNVDGITVYSDGIVVWEYQFGKAPITFAGGMTRVVSDETTDGYEVTVTASDGRFNVIAVNGKKRQAILLDARCGASKDCLRMTIKKRSDVIVCVPNRLRIECFGNAVSPPIGG